MIGVKWMLSYQSSNNWRKHFFNPFISILCQLLICLDNFFHLLPRSGICFQVFCFRSYFQRFALFQIVGLTFENGLLPFIRSLFIARRRFAKSSIYLTSILFGVSPYLSVSTGSCVFLEDFSGCLLIILISFFLPIFNFQLTKVICCYIIIIIQNVQKVKVFFHLFFIFINLFLTKCSEVLLWLTLMKIKKYYFHHFFYWKIIFASFHSK